MSKRPRTLDSFFKPPSPKKVKQELEPTPLLSESTRHPSYPYPLPQLPAAIREFLNFVPASEGRIINDKPDLDLLYFQPFLPEDVPKDLFEFLRRELFFYRVQYAIKRGAVETQINTPRYTSVFGLDETSRFDDQGRIVDVNGKPTPNAYKCSPRPIPCCLDELRKLTENATGCKFNFALVNYYATGNDSISYHSDDERFLGINPAIASFSLGATRDFLLKHKPTASKHESETKPMKFPLRSGDMILMRGSTQSHWLHSIPKRKQAEADKGRINITFRRSLVKGGTENYYRYNIGDGVFHKWDPTKHEMLPWSGV